VPDAPGASTPFAPSPVSPSEVEGARAATDDDAPDPRHGPAPPFSLSEVEGPRATTDDDAPDPRHGPAPPFSLSVAPVEDGRGVEGPRAATRTPRPRQRWPWFVLLLALGALGVWLAAPDPALLRAAWDRLATMPAAAIAIVVGGALGLVLTEALRIHVIGRTMGARIGARDAWDAAVANHVMTAITPQVGLGEPTVAYLLEKRGVPWDAAVAVPFLKFTSSLALVFAIGAALVVAGYGPPVDTWITASGLAVFLGIAVASIGVLVAALRAPLARRVIAAIHGWLARRRVFAAETWQARLARAADVARGTVDRLERVVRRSWSGVAVLVVVHLVYYASYIAPLVGLALLLGDPPLGPLVLRALVYLCFVFALPTPGGAGPSEAAAGVFFADLVPAADAIVVVVVFRAATFYLQLGIGVVYLPIAAALGRKR
jgi:uncharacterized protein (TIRG00374 family)